MRKMCLAIAVVSGFGVYGYAQAVTSVLWQHGGMVVSSPTSSMAIRAQTIEKGRGWVKLSGNVAVTTSDSRITADEAVFHPSTNEVELSGHVRVSLIR